MQQRQKQNVDSVHFVWTRVCACVFPCGLCSGSHTLLHILLTGGRTLGAFKTRGTKWLTAVSPVLRSVITSENLPGDHVWNCNLLRRDSWRMKGIHNVWSPGVGPPTCVIRSLSPLFLPHWPPVSVMWSSCTAACCRYPLCPSSLPVHAHHIHGNICGCFFDQFISRVVGICGVVLSALCENIASVCWRVTEHDWMFSTCSIAPFSAHEELERLSSSNRHKEISCCSAVFVLWKNVES